MHYLSALSTYICLLNNVLNKASLLVIEYLVLCCYSSKQSEYLLHMESVKLCAVGESN